MNLGALSFVHDWTSHVQGHHLTLGLITSDADGVRGNIIQTWNDRNYRFSVFWIPRSNCVRGDFQISNFFGGLGLRVCDGILGWVRVIEWAELLLIRCWDHG